MRGQISLKRDVSENADNQNNGENGEIVDDHPRIIALLIPRILRHGLSVAKIFRRQGRSVIVRVAVVFKLVVVAT